MIKNNTWFTFWLSSHLFPTRVHRVYQRLFKCWFCRLKIAYTLLPLFQGPKMPYWKIPIFMLLWKHVYISPYRKNKRQIVRKIKSTKSFQKVSDYSGVGSFWNIFHAFVRENLDNLWQIGINKFSLPDLLLSLIKTTGPNLFRGIFPQMLEKILSDLT